MRVLVLGGIRSGKSELAEALLAGAARVRYVATAVELDDPAWAARIDAHRQRRDQRWHTEEVGKDPGLLAELLAAADPDDALLVDDLGGWLTSVLRGAGTWADPGVADEPIDTLAEAVRACRAAKLVLVNAEVGLSLVPTTEAGTTFADANGVLNQRIAAACDGVALVVAGQPTWLRGGPDTQTPVAAEREASPPVPAVSTVDKVAPVLPEPRPVPVFADGALAGTAESVHDIDSPMSFTTGMHLPMPDDGASADAADRLRTLGFAGSGLGAFVPVVRFAAGTQGRVDPRPWHSPHVLLLRADRAGGFSAGDSTQRSDAFVRDAHEGLGPLAMLAATASATVQVVGCPTADAAEERDALDPSIVDAALTLGWRLASSAVDEGSDLLVLAGCGTGSDAAAAAVVAVVTGGEPAALLARVVNAEGSVDDAAWMARCAAVRDARHRIRARGRDPHSLLSMLGGGDLAVATGILLGAAARQTPVLIDGPIAVAAALVARDYGMQTRHWLLLPDHGEHPTVKLGADVLGLEPLLHLRLGLGEGATALTALPLLNTALTLACATRPEAGPDPYAGYSEQERIDAEIERVIIDSPTAELPLVPREGTAPPGE